MEFCRFIIFLRAGIDYYTMEEYLKPTQYLDSDHELVISYALENTKGIPTRKNQAVALYYAIRDGFRYNPYILDLSTEGLKASNLLRRNYGYCVEKAALLAATARVLGIPSRVGFANVTNHLGFDKYVKILRSNVLVFHGYTDLYLNNRWVKATPAFNRTLCKKLNVAPLNFNGEEDAVFQAYDKEGGGYMEYVKDHGVFNDIPREKMINALQNHYPHLFRGERGREHGFEITM